VFACGVSGCEGAWSVADEAASASLVSIGEKR